MRQISNIELYHLLIKQSRDGTCFSCVPVSRYAYFVLTRQEYLYPDAADRQRLMLFHKKAKKHRWDVEKYNRIKQVGKPLKI